MKTRHLFSLTVLLALFSIPIAAVAQGTAFNYTGQLMYSNQPVAGLYDLQFDLYNDPTNGFASEATYGPVSVSTDPDGVFTVSVNFETNVFDGALRWLEIMVETNGLPLLTLQPRQPLVLEQAFVAQDLSAQRLVVGSNNIINGLYSSILGGSDNANSGNYAVICGGVGNTDSGNYNFMGGGENNKIEQANHCTIVCGRENHIRNSAHRSSIVGGDKNHIGLNHPCSFIAGGLQNTNNGDYSTIAGGQLNYIRPGLRAVIGGGGYNTIWDDAYQATIAGGLANEIGNSAQSATISGGANNTNYSDGASIGGGEYNFIRGPSGSVQGQYSTISGGKHNSIEGNATDYSTIGGGYYNKVTQNSAYCTIPGGYLNEANASYTFAAGLQAKANNQGAFVWADSQSGDFASTADNEVAFRCGGGVRFTSASGGANQNVSWVPGSSAWSFSSDRNLKEGFTTVDSKQVLEKVAQLPVTEWNFKGYPQRHIGPVAQDFHALFPLNDSDTTLNSADLDGVALAAIQGLNQVVREKEQRISDLERSVAELKDLVQQLVKQQAGGAK